MTSNNNSNMVINVKKSACLRVGPRYDVRCKEITTSAGNSISWANQMRYIGVFIVKSRVFTPILPEFIVSHL